MSLPIIICGGFALDFIQTRTGGEYTGPTLGGDAITTTFWLQELVGKNAGLQLISEIPTDRYGNQLATVLSDAGIIFYPELRPNRDSRTAYWDMTPEGKTLNQEKSQLLETTDSRLHLLGQIDLSEGDGVFCLMSSAITHNWQLGWRELAQQAQAENKTIISSPNTRAIQDNAKREVYQQNLEEQLALSNYVILSRKDLTNAYPEKTFEEALTHLMQCCDADFIVTDGTRPTTYYANEDLKKLGMLTPLLEVRVTERMGMDGLDTVGAGGAFVAGFAARLSGLHIGGNDMPERGETSLKQTRIEVNDLIIQQYTQLITAGHAVAAHHIDSKKLGMAPWGDRFELP
ncbi:MAG TPA: PfkB family carbohydrate kinase [Alphaproteobacteria bacterium]|nr:hypothetical protein [Rhodospirillaceae bacterium]HRJ12308.1 PfkB family carbohydrate kinase [Alphaproteobacteria bacterium]